jgi:predicted lipoprotein with Yx(FWY)xxD motif
MRTSTSRALKGALITTFVFLAACGGKGDDTETAPFDNQDQGADPAAAGDSVAVKSATTDLGDILVGQNGMTLYGFTNDIDGVSTCSGTCAEAWPPVIVGPDWTVGPGLDSGVFSTVARDDGTKQLVAGKWPLYYYSGDTAPGDVKGQGSGDVWFVVGTDAKLIQDPAPAGGGDAAAAAVSVQVADSPLGQILVDGEGNTLYGFTNDADGNPTCAGDCAGTWPAHLIEGEPAIAEGLDPAVFTLVEGTDGGQQLKAGKWPLYRFSGDGAPGDVNGQGSGDVWFVVAPDGSLIKEAPSGDPAGADTPPPADDGGDGGEDDPYDY